MKNMKKLLQKAMVFTLTAAMLVGTPLTASAAGLVDLYKVEDTYGDTVSQDGENDTVTGTVTNTVTETTTGVLQLDENIAGIVLSETNVEIEMIGGYDPADVKKQAKLNVTIVGKDGKELTGELVEKLKKKFTWKSGDSAVVSLRNEKGKNPDTKGMTDEMTLVARQGGSATVTVSLDDYANNIHYFATASVVVKQYADKLDFNYKWLDEDGVEGSTLDLDEYVIKEPATASDKITYAIVSDADKSATLKNNMLTLKKNKKDKKVSIIAIGERVKSKPYEITIKESVPANKIEFYKSDKAGNADGDKIESKGFQWAVNTYGDVNTKVKDKDGEEITSQDFVAKLIPKSGTCNDRITSWTSKKPDIVSVKEVVSGEGRKNTQVKLSAKSAGTANITAKTASGKSQTFKVVVSANLTDIEIQPLETAYSGQTVQLEADQYFKDNGSKNFTDAGLKWEVCDAAGSTKSDAAKEMKKVASINAKTGALTIKPSISYKKGRNTIKVDELWVKASNSKKIGTGSAAIAVGDKKSNIINIKLKQISITSITVYGSTAANAGPIVEMSPDGNNNMKQTKKVPVTLAIDSSRTYRIVAEGKLEGAETASAYLPDGTPVAAALGWVSANTKVVKATKNTSTGSLAAIKKGKSDISITGSYEKNGKYSAIKATFKANVTQPTKSLKLTTKSSVIAAKNGSVKFNATMDKGTSTRPNEIVWSVVRIRGEEKTPFTFKAGASINLPLKLNAADVNQNGTGYAKTIGVKPGDKFTVTAKVVSSGLRTSKTVSAVEPSFGVKIGDLVSGDGKSALDDTGKSATLTLSTDDDAYYTMTPQIQLVRNGDFVNVGDSNHPNMAGVTYTVSKPGYVQIYGNRIYPLQKGNKVVKITPVSADGKKGTPITVTIN